MQSAPSQPKETKLLNRARRLRVNQTDVEKKLWTLLRDRGLQDYKFRRQEIIGDYIVDFLCKKYCLAIELDGGQHATQIDYDQTRDQYLKNQGYTVLRFWNNQINENIDGVWNTIHATLLSLTPTLSRKRERGF